MLEFLQTITLELSLLARRTSTWIIVSLFLVLGLFFSYVLPYISYRGGRELDGTIPVLDKLLPAQIVAQTSGGFPFFGGALVLILAVITFGNEFNWNMWKTLFTQRPGRTRIILAKLVALGALMLPIVLLGFAVNAVASTVIAQVEGASMAWPAIGTFAEAIGAGWLILMTWASFGVLLAILTRGTGLAIGIGILYALVIEGMVSGFSGTISWLKPVTEGLIRANAYSLTDQFGGGTNGGPGAFGGPYVDIPQAILALSLWLVACCGISLWLMRRRDVS